MKFMEKVWDNLGLFEAAGQDDDQKTGEPERRTKRHKSETSSNTAPFGANNVISLPTASVPQPQPALGGIASKQLKVMVVEPVSFDDAQHVADYLKSKKPVVVNFENTDTEISRRMIDFISGTTYALNGSIQKIGNHIFLCAPHNVDVSYTSRDERHEKNLFPWN